MYTLYKNHETIIIKKVVLEHNALIFIFKNIKIFLCSKIFEKNLIKNFHFGHFKNVQF